MYYYQYYCNFAAQLVTTYLFNTNKLFEDL